MYVTIFFSWAFLVVCFILIQGDETFAPSLFKVPFLYRAMMWRKFCSTHLSKEVSWEMLLFFLWSTGRVRLCLQPRNSERLLLPWREGWVPALISVHLIRLSLVLVQNQTGRKPLPNSLYPSPPRGWLQTLTKGRCERRPWFHGILAMVAASREWPEPSWGDVAWPAACPETYLVAGPLLGELIQVSHPCFNSLPHIQTEYIQLIAWFCSPPIHNHVSTVY